MVFKIGDRVRLSKTSPCYGMAMYSGIGRITKVYDRKPSYTVFFYNGRYGDFLACDLELVPEEFTLTIQEGKSTVFAGGQGAETESKVLRETSTEDLIANLRGGRCDTENKTSILPPGTVLYHELNNAVGIIIQEPPSPRTVRWSSFLYKEASLVSYQKYHLAFPYLIFGINIWKSENGANVTKVYVFYRNQPITSEDDTLYMTNLLNVRLDGTVCLGSSQLQVSNVLEAVKLVAQAFWSNVFNYDAGKDCYYYYAKDTTGNVVEWERRSKEDHMFVLNINWPESDYTVKSLMAVLLSGIPRARPIKVFDDLLDVCWQTQEIGGSEEWAG